MVPWKGTPFTNRGAFWWPVLFSLANWKEAWSCFFLQNPETSLLLKSYRGFVRYMSPPLENITKQGQVDLNWFHDWFDLIWIDLIFLLIMSGPLSRGCFREKTSPPRKGRGHFHLKLWRCKETPIRFPLHGVPIWRSIPPQGVFNIPVTMVLLREKNPAPVDMVNLTLFTGFYTSQVVQDFFHQQYHPQIHHPKSSTKLTPKKRGGGYASQTLRYGKGKTNPISNIKPAHPPFFWCVPVTDSWSKCLPEKKSI